MTKSKEKTALGDAMVYTFLELPEVTGISRSTIYNKLNENHKSYDPTFPKPFSPVGRTKRFYASEIRAWVAMQLEKRGNTKNPDPAFATDAADEGGTNSPSIVQKTSPKKRTSSPPGMTSREVATTKRRNKAGKGQPATPPPLDDHTVDQPAEAFSDHATAPVSDEPHMAQTPPQVSADEKADVPATIPVAPVKPTILKRLTRMLSSKKDSTRADLAPQHGAADQPPARAAARPNPLLVPAFLGATGSSRQSSQPQRLATRGTPSRSSPASAGQDRRPPSSTSPRR